jgi:hypothetical protein
MFEQVMVGAIVFTGLGLVVGTFVWAIVESQQDRKKQPLVEMPEWMQGLTQEQLRELLQTKQHASQPELHVMAAGMRALNSGQVRPQVLPAVQQGDVA